MSSTNVDELMAALSPMKRIAEIEYPIRAARESFIVPSIRVASRAELLATLGSFYAHLMSTVFGDSPPEDACRLEASVTIDEAYPGGLSAASAAATSGLAGGLPRVLDLLTEHILAHRRQNYFLDQFAQLHAPDDFRAALALVTAYLERYGEALFGSAVPEPERMVPIFKTVLREHIAFIEKNLLLVNSG